MTSTRNGAIVLVISVGWGVRTFLQTDVLPTLLERGPVVVLAPPQLGEAIQARWGDQLNVEPLYPFDPWQGATERIYRRYNAAFQHLSTTNTRRFNQRIHRPRHPRRRAVRALQNTAAAIRASPAYLDQLRHELRRAILAEHPHIDSYRRVFEAHDVRAVVPTVAYLAAEAVPAVVARDAGLGTACWVNSWDNMTSKGPFFETFDRYFVWSEAICRALRTYYPESREQPCVATGVPHFDWYYRADMQWTRASFCRRVDLDPTRPIVLYATCTPFLAPDEHLVVERLADDLTSLDVAPQLLVRLHPADAGNRFSALAARPDVRLQVPGGAREGLPPGLSTFCPTADENALAINTVRHADVVVNLASTISLEAALADRPTVNVAYDLAPKAPTAGRIAQYYDFEHYRTVLDHDAVTVARDPVALLSQVRAALADPATRREGRRSLAEHWCGPPGDGAGQRLGRALAAWLAEEST